MMPVRGLSLAACFTLLTACTSSGGARPVPGGPDDGSLPDGGSRSDGGIRGSDGSMPSPGKPWTVARGVYGGAIRAVAIDPQNPSTLWAGTSSAGIFKSTDGGLSWSPSGCESRSAELLAVDPLRPSTIFAACSPTNDGGTSEIFRSTDSGASWSPVKITASATYFYSLIIHPKTPGVIYAQTSESVYKSVDGGMSWGPASGGLTDRYFAPTLAVDPTDANIVYYLTTKGPYKSTDGGVTAVLRGSGIPGIGISSALWALALDPHAPQTLYVSAISVGRTNMFKSTDGALSWRETAGSPQSSNNGGDRIAVDAAGAIYSVWNAGIYSAVSKSSDGGASWTRINETPIADLPGFVVTHPSDPKKVFIAWNMQGLTASSDGGTTWRQSSTGITAADVYAVAFSPSSASVVYAGLANGQVVKSLDEGQSFLPTGSQIPQRLKVTALAVHPKNSDIVYAGTSPDYTWGTSTPKSGVWKSIDGGNTWYELELGTGGTGDAITQLVISPDDPKTVYAGARYKTTDEGITWMRLPTTGESLVLDPADGKRLFMSRGSGSDWMRSSDGGATWNGPWKAGMNGPSGVDLLHGLSALAIDPSAPATYYGCTADGLYRSTNAGSTWGHAGVGFMSDLCSALAIAPAQPQKIYALSAGAVLHASEDGATSWRQVATGLPMGGRRTAILAVSPSHPDTVLLGLTSSMGVLRTTTAGK